MKMSISTVLVLFLLISFSAVALSQQKISGKNGWERTGIYGIVDSIATSTYFNNFQVFENYGIPDQQNLFGIGWSKVFPSHKIPSRISGEFRLDRETNLDSIEIYISVQDSLYRYCVSRQRFVLYSKDLGYWKTFVWDWDMTGINFDSFNRVHLSFQLRTSLNRKTGGVVALRNLLGIDSTGTFVILK